MGSAPSITAFLEVSSVTSTVLTQTLLALEGLGHSLKFSTLLHVTLTNQFYLGYHGRFFPPK